MTASRDPDRLIRAFLEDGPEHLADRSYDAVRSHIDRTRQRVVIGPWREPRMSNFARVAMAAAAVVVVALVGYNLLPGSQGFGGPGPTASPTAVPTPTATPVALPVSSDLAPGRYYIADRRITNVARLILTMPAGWTTTSDTFLYKGEGSPGEVMLSTWTLTHIFPDACKWNEATLVDVGTTVDQLVSALADQKGRQASAPSEATVAGYPAKVISLAVPATLDTATCTNGNLRYWPEAGPNLSGGMCCNLAGNTDVIYVVDVAGKRLVLVARHYPGSSAADRAELQAIIDSIQIEP